jgi:chromosome segregation protein
MSVHIKRLELNGFKSFPRPSLFEFDSGITAVIGPNGSGKSNIADAMRWVLGEQSYSNLRGRKAEDVIFSGSTARSAVGMAEVTLTLDNTSGELPIEYQEVSITRRAYRSGENQYLINGSKVRLKDINHITASLGQAHTVIGQGLVDAALSQRPEERRGLFEHAAGITGLRMKHAATSRHLAETTTNSTRLEDLLTELEPRLKTLERQAKQAREFAEVQQDLRETTLRYYSSLWRDHRQRLKELGESAESSSSQLEQATRQLSEAQSTIETVTRELESLQSRSESLDQQITDKRDQLRELEHRIELTRQRKESFEHETRRYHDRRESLVDEAAQVDQQINQHQAEQETLDQQLAELESQLNAQKQERTTVEEQISSLNQERVEIDREREEIRQRLYRAEAEQEYRRQQQRDLQGRVDSFGSRRTEFESRNDELNSSIEQLQTQISAIERDQATQSEEISAIEASLSSSHDQIAQKRQDLEKLDADRAQRSARLDALQRLQESGEGLHRGVQTVLDASTRGSISGVIGTLASQITVPEQLETAIEAALGGHLQDIVVHQWADAEAAIELLKQRKAGRATFQPLDTQRRVGNQQRPSLQGQTGVHGIASDLIDFESEMEPILEGLIGRTVITDDLPSTRKILGKLRPGWTVVTLEGEVSRSGGSVTGGSRIRQSGTLGRERELRELPEEITRLDKLRSDLQKQLEQDQNVVAGEESKLQHSRQKLREIEGQLDSTRRDLAGMQQELQQTNEALRNLDSEASAASAEIETRSAEIEQLASQFQQDEARLAELDQQREQLVSRLEGLRSGTDDTQLHELENERSRLSERRQGITQQLQTSQSQKQRIQQQISQLDSEQATATRTIEELDAELNSLDQQLEQTRAELESLSVNQEPLVNQRSEMQQKLSEQQRALQELQGRQRELERQRDSQQFDIERETSQGDHLIERVFDILEIEDPKPLLEEQPVEQDLDMQKLETDLHRLRQRARRIGAFGEETIAQYEQEQERYTFLRSQLDDVQSGATALQSMLDELEKSMAEEFDRTFGRVAEEFQTTFQRLFGGGSAQLVRSDDVEDKTAIDIVAQPPGKKLQSLALLSGGERALTAVALLFSIQRVNPSPFCLLDEVDAALDESNVVRFRDELRDLSKNTQFVIVTHNRATIEGADVLYGITMGDDAISRTVSLKLPDEAPVATA